jgi:hypothetical protein
VSDLRDIAFAGIGDFARQIFGMQHHKLMKLLSDHLPPLFVLFIVGIFAASGCPDQIQREEHYFTHNCLSR